MGAWTSTRTIVVVVLLAIGCGGGQRRASDVRRELEASGLEDARETAPDLVAAARDALEEVERAEAAGELEAAADHATRARLLAEAALTERERAQADAARLEIEQRTIELEEQALRDEAAARTVEMESARLAASRAAREELASAMERAQQDEAQPSRRRRVSVGDDAQVRRAALAIRERARLLASAAAAMGGEMSALARVEELARRSANESAPMESLELAEQAHEQARALLGAVRRSRPAPAREEIGAAIEAIEAARLRALQLERGLAIELDDVFRAGTATPSASASGRIARAAEVLRALPHGPVAIEIDVSGTGDPAARVARQRGEWARGALIAAGVPEERVVWREPSASAPRADDGERVRLVLVAYAEAPAAPAAP
ncbi:hypothetical protein [Sandaracinus amylolyticus]|uniref:hypothetical protein n=1 Tax=Sandaracinus amylolyticus TaxID=927083 RepID=UPI001F2B4977|nr:hypothetical protein [Sandaracinus amylolyticus]UJR84312.1 Hypothetical protein I5071_63900 [Sandaracinus amylolyticus]